MKNSPRSTKPPLLPPTSLLSPVRTSFVSPPRSYCPLLSTLTIRSFLAAETWSEYGNQWREYYNTKVAGKPIPTNNGPTLPPLPTTEATGEEWGAWGKAVADAWTAFAASKRVDLAKVTEGLKYPEEPADDNWGDYAGQWGAYGDQVAARFKAELARLDAALYEK